ncbi:helix-turn-helix transcriptional regulator [Gandjariella thermophila]|uniref:LuxR family transcriptional regulator n=1 Tax=Gandjariella thermophila TaxID=1931992 RepID=A0A4D4J5Q7_9PSEU|nr:LuxR C-terminal-related transcriptional regulator [Gandjariella thermophila]GDY29836.1 LuxR family transcriptional regulator [Gandjariella thermophila]
MRAVATRRPGNLPAEVTSFVGRRSETAEVRRLLSVARLVTLTGVGGVGKTRLALRVATALRRAFPDGVWLVELAEVGEDALVPHTVAQALGIQDTAGRRPVELLVDFLRGRHLLLVLDNCEHVVDGAAELVGTLLREADHLRVLTTSRETLRVPGEHVRVVEPLPCPAPGGEAGDETAAVTLFTQRAAAMIPSFTLTPDNRADVARVCRRLDGLPLAIELAVVRLPSLSVTQLEERLDQRFRLLTSGDRAGATRHRTLRAVVDWSYELCTPAERVMWARTSVFAGAFGLDAAEEVCAGDGVTRGEVMELLASLVTKSILVCETRRERARYRLLETMRQYGRERLREGGAESAVRRRHAERYLRLAGQCEQEWFGPGQDAWLHRLQREHADLRAALEFCLGTEGLARWGLRMAAALWFHWIYSGLAGEGRRWLECTLAVDRSPTPERARALWAASFIATHQGDLAAAGELADEARHLAERLGEMSTLVRAVHREGLIATYTGDLERAERLLSGVLARYAELGEGEHAQAVLARLGLAAVREMRGDLDEAIRLGRECQRICQARGDHTLLSSTRYILARIHRAAGHPDQAASQAREVVRMQRRHGGRPDAWHLALCTEVLAWLAEDGGEHERAAVLLGAAAQVRRAAGLVDILRTSMHDPHRGYEHRARAALGDDGYVAAFDRGSRLSVPETIAFALGESPRRRLKRAAGGEPGAAPTGTDGASLTPREREVAELVLRGLSNKEIASELVISARTASTHVEHIMLKLGFSSRTQIAAWASTNAAAAQQGNSAG